MNRTARGSLVAGMVIAAGGPAFAGTAGGIYDMRAMLNERHPFAGGTVYGSASAPPPPPPPAITPPSMQAIAPPPPVMRFTPLPAPARDEPLAQRGAGTAERVADRSSPMPTEISLPSRRGFYLSVGAGFDSPEDLAGRTIASQSFATELDDGVVVSGAIGRYFGRALRGELEIAHRWADYDRTVVGGNQVGGGDLAVTTAMVNGYYDVDIGWRLVPYFGGGIGVALLDGADVVVAGDRVPGRDATEFAFQGMVGLTYLVTPSLGVGFDARYLGTSDDNASAISVGLNARLDL